MIGDAFCVKTSRSDRTYVHLSSIASIEVFEENAWEFLPSPEPSFWADLFCANRYPKTYKGQEVRYVGACSLTLIPAIKTGTLKRMRLHLIDRSYINCDHDELLVGAWCNTSSKATR